ncbi:hypothetical protein B0H14DRAFT_2614779 [Mycena olivaceomarginata]|nr:hypothetical protein B0H14DRAFT_2614779 [Mycena olivaceomarginata]
MTTAIPKSPALSDAHKSLIATIKAADFTMHPILSDYDAWMAEAPQAKEKFSCAAILAGDASLYESHIAEVIAECLPRTQEVSESVRLRTSILSSTLFQLVVLRVYLGQSARDNIQIYFLARRFSPGEYIAADDPLAAAKGGIVVGHLTIPETVLQVPETSAGLESMPRCSCTDFPGFLPGNGIEVGQAGDSPTNQSSPLSDPLPSNVEPDLGSDNKAPGGRKREREEGLWGSELNDSDGLSVFYRCGMVPSYRGKHGAEICVETITYLYTSVDTSVVLFQTEEKGQAYIAPGNPNTGRKAVRHLGYRDSVEGYSLQRRVARDEPIAIGDYGAQPSEAKLISRGVSKLELTFGTHAERGKLRTS